MAAIGQVYYNVLDNNSGSYITSTQVSDIFSDVVPAYGANSFTKLGIQAPPGTQVVLNNTKTIMIGRTGMYELDDDIVITNLYFVRPRKYQKDNEATQAYIESGTLKMREAEEARTSAMSDLNAAYPEGVPEGGDAVEAYWNRYNEIQSTYITSYQEGLNEYNQGVNGVFRLFDPENPDSELNFQDLYNVIIDFIYE